MSQHSPSPGPTPPVRRVINYTADATLSPQANGAVISNKGATGGITLTLPDPTAGLSYTITVSDSHNITLNPGTFGILWSGGLYSSLANGGWGNGIQLIGNGTHWVAPFSSGAWD